MAKGRELKGRIRTVQNTKKITKTMELVATSKMKRAQDRVAGARPYATALAEVIGDLWTPELAERFPLLRQPSPPAKGGPARVALVLITSNRGLAGGFNANLIKEARGRIQALEGSGYTVDLHCIGKKGAGFFKYLGRALASDRSDIGDSPTAEHARSVADALIADYEAGHLAAVELIQARFLSALSTPPALVRLLPIEPPAASGRRPDYILKPDAATILESLLPLYVRNMVYRGLAETAASEHAARRTAMKNATDNATEIVQVLTRKYNRQRQAVITQEIAEIVGGAAALEG
ncbi:MAG TPA: ATP synthase F1 subunit gamma [Gemmatimonadales bacterium]|nr:ATP synthase F1 subunit gamma [Gemmatimonadales bacterium]